MTQNKSFEIPPLEQSNSDKIWKALAQIDSQHPPLQEEPIQPVVIDESSVRPHPHTVLEKNEVNFSVSTINNNSLIDEDKEEIKSEEKSDNSVVIENEEELL
jgi:hypothetical protein